MAAQRGMKNFYIGLGVVALAGVGALLWARASAGGGSGPATVEPIPVSLGEFPGYVMGPDTAPVTIIEYGDFQCPACAQFSVLTGPDIKNRLVASGRVRMIFRDFPLDGHQNSLPAHNAAACAGEQGQFWAMHDMIYFRQNDWALDRRAERKFREYADALGLDQDQYRACVSERRYEGRILGMKQQGMQQGVSATPTFFIGNLRVSGTLPYDSIRALVDRAAAARPAP